MEELIEEIVQKNNGNAMVFDIVESLRVNLLLNLFFYFYYYYAIF